MATDTEKLIEYAEKEIERTQSIINYYSFHPDELKVLNSAVTHLEQFKNLVMKRKKPWPMKSYF